MHNCCVIAVVYIRRCTVGVTAVYIHTVGVIVRTVGVTAVYIRTVGVMVRTVGVIAAVYIRRCTVGVTAVYIHTVGVIVHTVGITAGLGVRRWNVVTVSQLINVFASHHLLNNITNHSAKSTALQSQLRNSNNNKWSK